MITSNRAVEEWPPLFHDELLAGAAMDRALDHLNLLVLEGDSYRNPGRRGRSAARAAAR